MSTAIKLTAGGATRLSIDSSTGLCTVANQLQVNQDATSLGIFKAQGATPEFRLNDAGGTPAAGFAFTDSSNLTELYCSDDLEIGPGGNTTINAGTGAFAFQNGGVDNFTVSGGGNTMRLNAPSGGQNFELNTAAISQQSEMKFVYGTPGSGTAGFGIYRPTNTRSLGFYNYALARNQVVMDTSGDTNFIGASGNTLAYINALGQILAGSTTAGVGVGRVDVYNTENNTNDPRVVMTKNKNGGNTSSGDNLGILSFNGWNSSTSRGAAISAIQNGANGAGGVPADMVFTTNEATTGLAERMRINTNGAVLIGTTVQNLATSGTLPRKLTIKSTGSDTGVITFYPSTGDTPYTGIGYDEANDGMSIRNNYAGSTLNQLPVFWKRNVNAGGTYSATNACMWILRDTTTLRSINAAGTLNANGADYAEYLVKDVVEETIAKGDVVGIKSNGKLTKKWSEAKSFLIKSTDPCLVGGDSWGAHLGMPPGRPTGFSETLPENPTQKERDEWAAKKAAADEAMAKWEYDTLCFNAQMEIARAKVDRMAYSGQVPVNVRGAVAGDYIIAVQGEGDSITGTSISEDEMTFAEYKKAVGRVIKVLPDGRAHVNVIVH